MRHLYGALLVAMLVVCGVCAESGRVCESRWLAGCMEFLWVNGFSFFTLCGFSLSLFCNYLKQTSLFSVASDASSPLAHVPATGSQR